MSSNDRGDAPVDGQPAVPRQRPGRPTSRSQKATGSNNTNGNGSSSGDGNGSANGNGKSTAKSKGSGNGSGKSSSQSANGQVDPSDEAVGASPKSSRPPSKWAGGRTLTVAPDISSLPELDTDKSDESSRPAARTGATTPKAKNGNALPTVEATPVEPTKNGSTLARTRDLLRGLRQPASDKTDGRANAPATSEVTNITALTQLAPSSDEATTASPLTPMRPANLAPGTQPEVRAVPLILPQPLVEDGEIGSDEYPRSDPAVAPVRRGHRVVQFGPGGRRRRPRVRRVTRVIRHVDPWSMFKVGLCFSFVLYGVCLTAGVLLWNVAYTTGTIDNVERFFESFGWETFEFKGGQLYHNAWIGGLFAAVGLTGLIVLIATLFNLITDLVGGIRVTVLEEEVVERHPSVARPVLRRRSGEIRIASEAVSDDPDFDDIAGPPLPAEHG